MWRFIKRVKLVETVYDLCHVYDLCYVYNDVSLETCVAADMKVIKTLSEPIPSYFPMGRLREDD